MISDRCILVTGASRGIGRAVCGRLLQGGGQVIGVARRFDPELELLPDFTPRRLDLADLDRLPAALQQLLAEHPAIDALVCNAGTGRFGALEQFSADQVRGLVDLNLTSQILLVRAFLPALKRRGRGDIVFIGSEAARRGGRRGAVYAATKFALRGLAQSLREECASSGVRVGIVNPGMVLTSFFDDLDFRPDPDDACHLKPEDVAEAVLLMLEARAGAVIDEISLSPRKRVIRFSGG